MGNQDERMMYWLLAGGAEDLVEAAKGKKKPAEVLLEVQKEKQPKTDGEMEEGSPLPEPVSAMGCHLFRNCLLPMLLFLVIVSGVFLLVPFKEAEQEMVTVEFPPLPKHMYNVPLHPRIGKSFAAPLEVLHFQPGHPSYSVEGAAVIHEGKAYLTSQETTDDWGVFAKKHSIGRLTHIHQLPIKPREPSSGAGNPEVVVSSFRTSFVFSIDFSRGSRAAIGDGLAFIMMPVGSAMGKAGENMGVIGNSESKHTFAVEFDTWENPSLGDISNNHVGINVNSMASVKAANVGFWKSSDGKDGAAHFEKFDLTRRSVQAWIEYDGDSQILSVSVSPDLGSKPVKPLMREKVDLSEVLKEFMMVGFSAGTGQFAAKHVIHSWEFEGVATDYFQSVAPGSTPEEPRTQFWKDGARRGMRIPRSRWVQLQSRRPFPDLESLTPVWMAPHPKADSWMKSLKSVPADLRDSVKVGLNNFALGIASMEFSHRDDMIWKFMCVVTAFTAGLIFLHMLLFTSQFLLRCSYNATTVLGLYARGGEDTAEQQQEGYVLIVGGEPGQEAGVRAVEAMAADARV